jgi:hypothetical protein
MTMSVSAEYDSQLVNQRRLQKMIRSETVSLVTTTVEHETNAMLKQYFTETQVQLRDHGNDIA